ncbi:MAG: helix-turn-helix domain-containing protein [Candidatus Thermoplasmatota archaeon]|jgi:predicted DNA binding protein|nr:helix-turn-helix domain-containing protein [Candidatus Thermoplasmatota archaeon]MCL5984779.1 helix-turn-helix domain-containing protein [Candidatus Thermoplasmatota archaeon]
MAEEDDSKSVICRISMPLHGSYNSYHFGFAEAHPELSIQVLSRMEVGDQEMMEDIRVTGEGVGDSLKLNLQKGKGVKSVETLERSRHHAVYRLTLEITPMTKIFRDLHLLMRYPVSFSGGVVDLLVVAHPEKIRQLLTRLKANAPNTVVTAIRQDVVARPEDLLTPKQLEVFRLAISRGYWDVPRRTTLSDLASLAHVAKSTISETLANIEKKLMNEAKDRFLQ